MHEMLEMSSYRHLFEKWQDALDILAQATEVPAALIMHTDGEMLEVVIASDSYGNPYKAGARELCAGSGLYCERVIRTRERLLVPNALIDPAWCNNPDIKHNMVSYLGFPLILPDGEVFGTICILDEKENNFGGLVIGMVQQFKRLVEMDFQLLAESRSLQHALAEISQLQGLLPICARCKKIRDDAGLWKQIEEYLSLHHQFAFTHTLCNECANELYPELALIPPATDADE